MDVGGGGEWLQNRSVHVFDNTGNDIYGSLCETDKGLNWNLMVFLTFFLFLPLQAENQISALGPEGTSNKFSFFTR